nr:hypothetical protein DO63_5606 [Burkholderia pseudomallei]
MDLHSRWSIRRTASIARHWRTENSSIETDAPAVHHHISPCVFVELNSLACEKLANILSQLRSIDVASPKGTNRGNTVRARVASFSQAVDGHPS